MLGMFLGMLAGGICTIVLFLLMRPAQPHILLWLPALLLPYALVSAQYCSHCDHLIQKLLGPEWPDLR